MNILFFSELSPFLAQRVGGAENSMRLIAEGLAARGHSVTFASLRPDPLPFPRRLQRGAVAVLLLPNPRRSVLARALDRLRLGQSRPAAAWSRLLWDRVGRMLFRACRPEVLYAFYEIDFLERAIRARDGGDAPGMAIVTRMAGLNWYETIRRSDDPRGREAIAAVFNGVDAINYLSPASRDLVTAKAAEVGLGLAPRASFVADIGVDVGRVPRVWAGPSPGPGLRVVVATRFSAFQKRQDILVDAVARLKGRLDVRVTMIGTGPRREAILRRRDELGLTEMIEIVPFMAQAALWERMAACDLLCHPADHEGVSKIILEAMMLGLPVLASDVAPIPEYVIEGETGFRAANDPEAWAAKLMELAADKARLQAVSPRARAFVEENYDTGRNIARFEFRFRELGAAGSQGPERRPGPAAAPPRGAGSGHLAQ